MPRENAGHTGQASRNPGGRGSAFPGEKKISTFFLTLDTRADLKRLAAHADTSQNAFVEGLIRRYGPQYAADLLIVADSLKEPDAAVEAPASVD
jgi:hypothetical protein